MMSRRLAPLFLLVALFLLVGAGLSAWTADKGTIVVDQQRPSLSGTLPEQEIPLRFTVRNTTGHAIRIIGADDRCDTVDGCCSTKGLPLTIPAGEERPLDVLFKTRRSPYTYRMTLYTDDPRRTEVLVLISG